MKANGLEPQRPGHRESMASMALRKQDHFQQLHDFPASCQGEIIKRSSEFCLYFESKSKSEVVCASEAHVIAGIDVAECAPQNDSFVQGS